MLVGTLKNWYSILIYFLLFRRVMRTRLRSWVRKWFWCSLEKHQRVRGFVWGRMICPSWRENRGLRSRRTWNVRITICWSWNSEICTTFNIYLISSKQNANKRHKSWVLPRFSFQEYVDLYHHDKCNRYLLVSEIYDFCPSISFKDRLEISI